MILHVDMDAFYASVEERERPELVGKPLIVGGTPQGRGVVAAANYAVRKFGVPRRCHAHLDGASGRPQAIVVRPRLDFYAEVSEQIREILCRYTPLVEPLSLDEAFVDVTGSELLFGPAIEIARKIKREIRDSVRLVASVGVAPNKFLAKIASDLQKPDMEFARLSIRRRRPGVSRSAPRGPPVGRGTRHECGPRSAGPLHDRRRPPVAACRHAAAFWRLRRTSSGELAHGDHRRS